jgi:Tfp pilus assembly protein PilV
VSEELNQGAMFTISRKPLFNGQSKRRKSLAFSIIEVMTASTILALSITGTLSLSVHSLVIMDNVRDFSRANQILQEKMEDIRMLAYSKVQTLPSSFYDPNDPDHRFSGTITKQSYHTDWLGNEKATLVTLKVSWEDKYGKIRTQSLSTVFSSGGLNVYIF